MGCGCKENTVDTKDKISVLSSVKLNLFMRIVVFLLSLTLVPLITLIMIIILFNHFVLGKGVSIDWFKKFGREKEPVIEYNDKDIDVKDYVLLDVINDENLDN